MTDYECQLSCEFIIVINKLWIYLEKNYSDLLHLQSV